MSHIVRFIIIFIMAVQFLANSVARASQSDSLKQTTIIGKQEWTINNLNVSEFRNGDKIPEVRTEEEWIKALKEETPAWCYYNNDPGSAEKYGKLYNIYAVTDPRGLAPIGWHIPSVEEWNELVNELGTEAGHKLKSGAGWNDDGNGSNSSGFTALPGGTRYSNGKFYNEGDYALYAADDGSTFFLTTGLLRGINRPANLNALSVRLVRRKPYSGYDVLPSGVPNPGITFVDNEKTGRASHHGNVVTEAKNGDILAFYTNASGIIDRGHQSAGWTEYRRSTDGGKTWGEPIIFDYSKKIWNQNWKAADGNSIDRKLVMSAVTAPNGNIIVFAYERPLLYFVSYDNGNTWSEPKYLDDSETGQEEAHRLFNNSVFVHEDDIYVIVNARQSEMTVPGPQVISLYVSEDNGETFQRRSGNIFGDKGDKNEGYITGNVLDDGSLIVYAYQGSEDEHNAPYVISRDKGYTWSEVQYTFLEKKTRHMSLSDKVGDYYFMTNRSGNVGFDSDNLVLYKSEDGINWDSGVYLNRGEGGAFPGAPDADSYSGNEVIGKYDDSIPNILLIQSSISYSKSINNVKHWWLVNISGTQISEE